MNVAGWKTPERWFPWAHVQLYMERIDAQVHRLAMEFARGLFLSQSSPCPQCQRQARALLWVSVSDPEEAWERGLGRVGFLTLCEACRVQVDFFVDPELTALQEEQWRECKSLS